MAEILFAICCAKRGVLGQYEGMLWRILSAVIVLFWAVMTGLIIRDTYFPDHSRFAVVPPRFVFDLFLSEAAALNNTLHLYHDQEKVGHTTFSIRRLEEGKEVPIYALQATGTMRMPGAEEGDNDVTFRLVGELAEAERWQSFDLEVKSMTADVYATIVWKEGEKLPKVEVKQAGKVVMNTQFLQTMMTMKGALAGVMGGRSDLLAQLTQVQAESKALPLTAREGVMVLAGKQRHCYIVTLKLLQKEEVRIFFTEVGELARVEFPQGYRFVEPMMHGLERGMNTLE